MKRIRFHEDARRELTDEAAYYAAISPRLGERFVDAIESAIRLAAEYPSIGSPGARGTRRVFPKRFRFSIVYVEQASEIVVLAIAPFARRPGYWRDRSPTPG